MKKKNSHAHIHALFTQKHTEFIQYQTKILVISLKSINLTNEQLFIEFVN